MESQAQTGTALVRHAPTLNGRVEGSVQVLTAESVTFNSSANVTGDLLLPGTPTVQLNGNVVYGGTVEGLGVATPTSHKVMLNTGSRLGHVIRRTDPVALPSVGKPPQPTGTRSVSLNSPGQSPGDFSTLKNLTLNSNVGHIVVPPGTYGNFNANAGSGFTLGVVGDTAPALYHFQNLTLNSNSSFTVIGPVVVTVDGGFSTNADMGASGHSEWLQLRIAGGGLSVNGSRTVHAFLKAPDGTLTLNGGSRFVGAVSCDRLIVNSSAVLQLVPPAVNQLPSVTITRPVGLARFVAPASFALEAEAADSDGTVTRVDFYQGDVKVGEATAVPYVVPWSLAAPGSYTFTAKAIDDKGAVATSTELSVVVQAEPTGLPFVADFEPGENYRPGALHGQQGWTATDKVAVLDEPNASSAQEVTLPGGEPSESLQVRLVGGTISPVFTDVLLRPVAAASPEDAVILFTHGTRVALVGTSSSAVLQAAQGSAGGTVWLDTGYAVPVDTSLRANVWLRLTLREDYTTGKWDLYADGRMIAVDLPFNDPATASYTGFSVIGHASQGASMDDFYAGVDNPLFADADLDGMDDTWETARGLNPAVNDRTGDSDDDRISNIQEYLLGTHPTQADTDGDGLADGWERQHGFNPISADDNFADTDLDGLMDGHESQSGTNPRLIDSDSDGIGDAVEVLLGYDPTRVQAGISLATDADGDGLTLEQELVLGTDPAVPDSLGSQDRDGDGLPDKWELAQGLNPLVANIGGMVNEDADGDGLTLIHEARVGTNPQSADTDGDGMRDDHEVHRGLDPLADDGTADPDGDSLNNREEYRRGTNPRDYYNGIMHEILPLIGGDFDLGSGGVMAVRVVDAVGNPLINAPVTLTIESGDSQIALTLNGPLVGQTADVRTGSDGIARVYLRTP
ncbi:hypothetical protein ESB00_03980 [Oleiharenicola lentus]|uniref:Uncharacterized protein n=1 Tax=Oleiharenicola lentus TaxID=2508720 RepID=A0A4Q1C859_9BACT|nr:Ig-like domain-containing protein [Oleiharenicola lentus]RXK55068.1 hypothetical protein ESB00_03980 [Oleiharenicola lentus]